MSTALVVSALLMGLAGSPHCASMCGAACAAIARRSGGHRACTAITALHVGRVLSYALAGAVVAASAQALASWSQEIRWIQPFWGMLHVAAIALGLSLLWSGRQPRWMSSWGQGAGRVDTGSKEIRWVPASRLGAEPREKVACNDRSPIKAGLWGLAWAAWPCGLLQSALLLAALSSTPAQGAAVMTVFALGSALGLWLGPWIWLRLQGAAGSRYLSASSAVRLAGVLLVGSSAWALGHGLWSASCRAFC